jgi:hypothetical protein
MDAIEIGFEYVDWVDLDRDQRRAALITVIGFHKKAGNVLSS